MSKFKICKIVKKINGGNVLEQSVFITLLKLNRFKALRLISQDPVVYIQHIEKIMKAKQE